MGKNSKEIIYLANARIPTEKAHGIQIMKMCEAFSQQGVKTELVVPWRFNKIKEDLFDYYQIKRIFKIRKLPSLDLIPLGLPKIGFWIQSLSFALSVCFYLLFKKANIIYSRDPFSLFFLSFFKKNLVYEAHTFPGHFFWYKYFLKKISGLITITKKLKDKVKQNKEECRQRFNLPLDKKIVLYTGHLYEENGVYTLLQSAEYLSSYLFVFVGGTDYDISNFKVKSSKFENVFVVGHRSHKEIPFWLKAGDVLVLPTSGKYLKEKYYVSSLKLFEYMASQKPIVASDLPSTREILNQNNSILVKPDDPKALAEGIKVALRNIDLSDKIAYQAYQDVQNYTWQKRAKNILESISR